MYLYELDGNLNNVLMLYDEKASSIIFTQDGMTLLSDNEDNKFLYGIQSEEEFWNMANFICQLMNMRYETVKVTSGWPCVQFKICKRR